MTAAGRAERTAAADRLCLDAYGAAPAAGPTEGVALIAVGGYGRGELAPHSDLDVVLVHDDGVDLGELAHSLWYPLWDSGARLDHAVRGFSEMTKAAGDDVKVALGLLDLRHLAGDPNLTLRLRTTLLTQWRREARDRLPELRALTVKRHEVVGELAHAAVPDLKEGEGGLRDTTVLKGLVATWLVDVPHADLERTRRAILDVRDVVQDVAGRATDRVVPELWPRVAERLGLATAGDAQRQVRELGRRVTHLSRLTWRRADALLAQSSGRTAGVRAGRGPDLTPVAPGVALLAGEIVLARNARPERDPLLLLRAAAEAAERDAVLNPAAASRLAKDSAPLPDPWPEGARQLLVRLLAAGPGLRDVWSTLDETGALGAILPEWERIRLVPHASVIHRFTVDRHVVETCVEGSALIRRVSRPDVLMVAALLHDIGKGGLTEHCVAGEPIARAIAARMGFEEEAVTRIARLVRWHLLLAETATTRDPDDPATVAEVLARIPDLETLDLLSALTEADARATAAKAWSTWRASLVGALVSRVRATLVAGDLGSTLDFAPPAAYRAGLPAGAVDFAVEADPDGARITVTSADRVGLLADVAAVLGLQRASIRGARAWTHDGVAVSQWHVADAEPEPGVLRQRYEGIIGGRVDPAARLRLGADALAPSVVVRAGAATGATVLEVRAKDRPGVLFHVLRALATLDITVRSAHVDTLGPQVVDVFYLQEASAGVLSDLRAAQAAHAVRAALSA